jgi:MoaA/NifB/PqqE/SkfB family radical SAM enzyme
MSNSLEHLSEYARCIAEEIMEQPTQTVILSGLDPDEVIELRQLVRELSRSTNGARASLGTSLMGALLHFDINNEKIRKANDRAVAASHD